LKYIINILIISFMFFGCNTKEIVQYKIPKDVLEELKSKKHFPKKKEKEIVIQNKKDNNIRQEDQLVNKINNKINEINASIAIVYSSRIIGKYAVKVSNMALTYMIEKNDDFSLEFIDMYDNSIENIKSTLDKLRNNNITKIMMYLTNKDINNLSQYEYLDDFDIYLPLVNKDNSDINNTNIIYGAINYQKQFKKLKNISKSKLIEVYDNTYRSRVLHYELHKNNDLNKYNITSYILSGKYPNYKRFLKTHKLLQDSSLILNLNIVKSSILLSQIRASEDINITEALSVQSNFNPLLFSLTQKEDVKNLILANSIKDVNPRLEELSRFLGNDIQYDWVNYSSILGLEYLKYKKKVFFNNINILNQEVNYPINLYKSTKKSFKPYLKEYNDTIY